MVLFTHQCSLTEGFISVKAFGAVFHLCSYSMQVPKNTSSGNQLLHSQEKDKEGDECQLYPCHLDQWFSTGSDSGARSCTGHHLVIQYIIKLFNVGCK